MILTINENSSWLIIDEEDRIVTMDNIVRYHERLMEKNPEKKEALEEANRTFKIHIKDCGRTWFYEVIIKDPETGGFKISEPCYATEGSINSDDGYRLSWNTSLDDEQRKRRYNEILKELEKDAE